MLSLKTKIFSAFFTVFAALTLFVGAASADTTVIVDGNGSGSLNEVDIADTQSTTVSQTNDTEVVNTVDTTINTGDNSASNNTGGSNAVLSGSATDTTTVTTTGSSNALTVADCNCQEDTAVSVSGNGATVIGGPQTESRVTLTRNFTRSFGQSNLSRFNNSVLKNLRTGGNIANNNTAPVGDAEAINGVESGSATSGTGISTGGSTNTLEITATTTNGTDNGTEGS